MADGAVSYCQPVGYEIASFEASVSLPISREQFRSSIMEVQGEMLAQPQIECPVTHHFAPGAYGREILLPKGSLVVGKIHKHSHINVISKGRVSVITETGRKELSAPCTFVSDVGTKRAVYAHEDTVWTTIHVSNETDLEKLEDDIIAKSYDELSLLEKL
jgi:hypothetical protein